MNKIIPILLTLLDFIGKFDVSFDYEDGKIKVCIIIDPKMIKDK